MLFSDPVKEVKVRKWELFSGRRAKCTLMTRNRYVSHINFVEEKIISVNDVRSSVIGLIFGFPWRTSVSTKSTEMCNTFYTSHYKSTFIYTMNKYGSFLNINITKRQSDFEPNWSYVIMVENEKSGISICVNSIFVASK